MEKLVEEGLVRHIGVCNYGTALLRDLLSYARIRPAVLQIELHPFLTQEKLVRFALESGLAVTAFSPLGAQSYHSIGMAEKNESVLDHPTIRDIAWLHGHTPAQVVLRWALQRGTSIVPKTTRFERLHENLALHEFGLSAEEMGAVSALDRNRRFNDPGVFGERAFNTFCPIYE
jgi:diketogulonate reductase-like aldo/keto reductase